MLYRPIAVFDSGLGSLSVVRELRKALPYENILYFADKMNFPYGNKTKEDLKSVVLKSINFLGKYQPKLIVIASITPSIQIYDEIKDNIPYDVIPTRLPLKRSIDLSRKNHVAIMASRGTLESKEFSFIIRKEVPQHVFIEKIDSSEIIKLVEDGTFLFDQKSAIKKIRDVIKPRIDDSVDVVAMCSTHLPFIKNYMERIVPNVKFVNCSTEVARSVKSHLKYTGDMNKNGTGKLEILVSADKDNFQSVLRYIGVRELIFDVSLQL